ncbi:MAG: DeoR/GlpR transcriptional regulator [Microbacteriaceae bacterium]|nr:MAG: DeoR/GlpR transcriptional regulator [Microbacteriaceae bacterium]
MSVLCYCDQMQRKHRLNEIVSAIVENGTLGVAALAERFTVSQATIRRDLEVLEKQQLVSRTHGGATTHAAFNDLPLGYKVTQDLAEKRRIAERALRFLDGAKVIGMTGGTTMTEFARLLLDREGLTVITNALNIATDLLANPGLRVFAAGGEVRRSSQETVGPNAESFLSSYNIDIAFLGVDGVDAVAGCTNYDPIGARVNATLLNRGKMSVVLADATKISRVALAQVCPISDVNVLITDSRAPQDALDQIRRQGCDVICV